MNVKIIAAYLPQYHETPENNQFWGQGYTDWRAVKKAHPVKGWQLQPKTPLNKYYYDLSRKEDIRWQTGLAKKYGIYGFNIYHYWFDSSRHYLGTPADILLENKDMDIHFMFTWDNGTWVRNWKNVKFSNDWISDNGIKRGILAELKYGSEKEWKLHLDYLIPFFLDERYIKIDDKPVFAFFNQNNEPATVRKMINYWDGQLKRKGLNGLYAIGVKNNSEIQVCRKEYLYEPHFSGLAPKNFYGRVRTRLLREMKQPQVFSYDRLWERLLSYAETAEEYVFLGGFVSYDDTPRRGNIAKIVKGASPGKFEKYMDKLIQISKEKGKEYIFLTAWNEWGEGAYLEPDEQCQYKYLEALQRALNRSG